MQLTIHTSTIAGVSHAKPNITEVKQDDQLTLVPEPWNEYDPQAVRVDHAKTNQKLGYIPAESTRSYHDAISQGFTLRAFVTRVDVSGRTPKVHFQVVVESPLMAEPLCDSVHSDPR